MDDWIGLVVLVACIGAFILARRRKVRQISTAMAAVKLEGFEAGRAAVLASIGSTVVVNTHVGNRNGTAADYDGTAAAGYDTAAAFGAYRRPGDGDRAGLDFGVPAGLPAGRDGCDPRVSRLATVNDDDTNRIIAELQSRGRFGDVVPSDDVHVWPRDFDDASRVRRPPGDGPGRGPGA